MRVGLVLHPRVHNSGAKEEIILGNKLDLGDCLSLGRSVGV